MRYLVNILFNKFSQDVDGRAHGITELVLITNEVGYKEGKNGEIKRKQKTKTVRIVVMDEEMPNLISMLQRVSKPIEQKSEAQTSPQGE